jgi:methylthioribose-1-phosphate isomerase
MKVGGKPYTTIWSKPDDASIVQVIDQRRLPHEFIIEDIHTCDEMIAAIKDMHIRGAGLIGAAAAYAMYLAALHAPEKGFDDFMERAAIQIKSARPTAVNPMLAVDRQLETVRSASIHKDKVAVSFSMAHRIAEEDAEYCRLIGVHGLPIIEEIHRRKKGGTVNILTHCNAGWLAFVDYGSATAPIYGAFDKGIPVHVWVDETRPRNQGSKLTAWELGQMGVPHTVIADNTGGHLMQHGLVDMVIVGSDRTTRSGDVANKIGTYLKALAAFDNGIPFYAALPSSTFDWTISDGVASIPIEERSGDEVRFMDGLLDGRIREVMTMPAGSPAVNYGFDVTPARLVTGLITERGVCRADPVEIGALFPDKAGKKDV